MDPSCADGCQAKKEVLPEAAEENCKDCPWSQAIERPFIEVIRIHQLIKVGIHITRGDLTRWQENALLIVAGEFAHIEKERLKDGATRNL